VLHSFAASRYVAEIRANAHWQQSDGPYAYTRSDCLRAGPLVALAPLGYYFM